MIVLDLSIIGSSVGCSKDRTSADAGRLSDGDQFGAIFQ
jgi:hypothetical protein